MTEIPLIYLEESPIAPAVTDLENARLALVTSMGIVPAGNPDGFRPYRNTRWGKYSIENLDSMQDEKWDVIHIGYSTGSVINNPNYGIPLDVCRKMESEHIFTELYRWYYAATGAQGVISDMQDVGQAIARDMKAEGVDFVILTSA